MSLKLIAVRPLQGCNYRILKNLSVEEFYFFDNNYKSDSDGRILNSFKKSNIPSNFFYSPRPGSSLNTINIQALVGKNGEGKSSLIELVIRILNNFYKQFKIGAVTDNLFFSEGVVADLYFEKDDKIFKIHINSNNIIKIENKDSIIAQLEENYQIIYDSNNPVKQSTTDPKKSVFFEIENFFFTMYINYSIYGLDETEYINETTYANNGNYPFDVIKNIEGLKFNSWLSQIFHKNDGYQTPIVIHPYRIEGQIDIKNEKYLVSQRLLSLIIEEGDNKYYITQDLFADKLYLSFKENDALDEYLENYIKNTIQSDEYYKVEAILEKSNESISNNELLKRIETYYQFIKDNNVLLQKFKNKLKPFVKEDTITDLFRVNISHFSRFATEGSEKIIHPINKKNLQNYLDRIQSRFPSELWIKFEYILKQTEGFNFQIYNLYQTLSIYQRHWSLLFNINEAYLQDSNNLFEKNLLYYIIIKSYKTIRYPKYRAFNRYDTIEYFIGQLQLNTQASKSIHEEYLEKSKKEDSHISLKIRQSIEILNIALDQPNNKLITFYKSCVNTSGIINFNQLKRYFDDNNKEVIDNLLLLPPRVFDTQIFLKSQTTNQENVNIKKISSGEYQKNAIISSLIYHLKNLDSVQSQSEQKSEILKMIKFDLVYSFTSIYVIFDEIELYFHPEFQRQFIKELLFKISKTNFKNIKNINFLFITHSPFILSDIPKNNVLFLEKGKPNTTMTENTFASNIHTLLQHGFFLNSVPIGDFAKDKINYYFKLLHEGKTIDDEGNAFYNQLLLVGEPFIKAQLLKLYNDLSPEVSDLRDAIQMLDKELKILKNKLNDKN